MFGDNAAKRTATDDDGVESARASADNLPGAIERLPQILQRKRPMLSSVKVVDSEPSNGAMACPSLAQCSDRGNMCATAGDCLDNVTARTRVAPGNPGSDICQIDKSPPKAVALPGSTS